MSSAKESACEDLYRWSVRAADLYKHVRAQLEKNDKKVTHVQRLARQGKYEEALELKANVEGIILMLLGRLLEPTASKEDAVELARRTYMPNSLVVAKNTRTKHWETNHIDASEQKDRAVARQRIEALAHEVTKAKMALVPSEEVIAEMADRGWNVQQWANAWTEFLSEVFRNGSLKQKGDALKMFWDWKRSIEPKVTLDVQGDLDSLSEEQLRDLRNRLMDGFMERLGEGEEA